MLRLAESRAGHATGALGREMEFGRWAVSWMMEEWTYAEWLVSGSLWRKPTTKTPHSCSTTNTCSTQAQLQCGAKPFRAICQRPCHVSTNRQDPLSHLWEFQWVSAPTWTTNALQNSIVNRFAVLALPVEEESPRDTWGTLVSSEVREEKLSCRCKKYCPPNLCLAQMGTIVPFALNKSGTCTSRWAPGRMGLITHWADKHPSAYGQRSLGPGGNHIQVLNRSDICIERPQVKLGITTTVVNRVLVPSSLNSSRATGATTKGGAYWSARNCVVARWPILGDLASVSIIHAKHLVGSPGFGDGLALWSGGTSRKMSMASSGWVLGS